MITSRSPTASPRRAKTNNPMIRKTNLRRIEDSPKQLLLILEQGTKIPLRT